MRKCASKRDWKEGGRRETQRKFAIICLSSELNECEFVWEYEVEEEYYSIFITVC